MSAVMTMDDDFQIFLGGLVQWGQATRGRVYPRGLAKPGQAEKPLAEWTEEIHEIEKALCALGRDVRVSGAKRLKAIRDYYHEGFTEQTCAQRLRMGRTRWRLFRNESERLAWDRWRALTKRREK